jgi:alpha-glucoside transport system substrate-binding protein
VVFDMSDQTPPAFGGQKSADEWNILSAFVGNPSNPAGTAAQLEAAAKKDYPPGS